MAICALGYIGARSDQLDDWKYFAGKILGMQAIDRGSTSMAFRMDDRKQRLVVSNEPGDTIAFLGWEVETANDLEHYASRLENAGHAVNWGSSELADRRFVEKLICFSDPHGNQLELFYGPMITSDPFVPGRPTTGFKTGPYGMGHVVLNVTDADELAPFYKDILDFKVSDYGRKPYPMYFFHLNDRHHSFAMVGTGMVGFHHFMVEFNHMDDVGQGFDLALKEDDMIAFTLGKHTNDYMFSYYAKTPSKFFVESGWGGRIIDPATWEPHETDVGPSFWGHDRLYMPDDLRQKFYDKKLDTAARGLRTPPVVDCPWLYSTLASVKK